ncbi:uncharacterized protein [Mytilus edulis]|uniref:uncharacterized protein n=1 Tax=Mytilus edulis TaxID=6550 RepID=UPI0039F1075D
MLSAFVFVFGLLFVFGGQDADNDQYRRLLLNDPDVIGNRLAHLESTLLTVSQNLQSVTSSLTDLQTKYTQQGGLVDTLKKELTSSMISLNMMEKNYTHQTEVIDNLQKDMVAEKAQHARDIQNLLSRSSTYIRWGRDNCSGDNTELVYSGYAGGEKYNNAGGASNMLCLTNNPEFSDKSGSGRSFIFGTEFEGNQFASDSNDEDVPCALCRSGNTSSSVMIPGRKSCYAGWKEEYNGILASSANNHAPSPYLCVDAHPTYVNGGNL